MLKKKIRNLGSKVKLYVLYAIVKILKLLTNKKVKTLKLVVLQQPLPLKRRLFLVPTIVRALAFWHMIKGQFKTLVIDPNIKKNKLSCSENPNIYHTRNRIQN